MNICKYCQEQKAKRRHDSAHQFLKQRGEQRTYRGGMFGGYEEQDYVCSKCDSRFIHSSDKNDCGWIFCSGSKPGEHDE